MSDQPPPRIASHDDDPSAPLAERLLLALGIDPAVVAEFGEQTVIDAAVLIKTYAHKFPMVSEDYGAQQVEIDRLRSFLVAVGACIECGEVDGQHDEYCEYAEATKS